jgi:5-oxoprolinase (ATP-hydrolysing) subunit C
LWGTSNVIEVITAGLETTIQDYPGRVGYWNIGIPPSGPLDDRSFRVANLLVGNHVGAAGLEIQLVGPTLRFDHDASIALTGAEVRPKLDGDPTPMWQTVAVRAGQVLKIGTARTGLRAYLCVNGGIATEPVLGSRSTFVRAGIGGIEGGALVAGQHLPIGPPTSVSPHAVSRDLVPDFSGTVKLEVLAGPHDDWLDEDGRNALLNGEWTVQAQSDRTGYRLAGPQLSFSPKAYDKTPDNGVDPSNVINTGYPIGGVNICGGTPIILPVDGPSEGGFINPFTVASGALWKLGQARPGSSLRFALVSLREALQLRQEGDRFASEGSLDRSA